MQNGHKFGIVHEIEHSYEWQCNLCKVTLYQLEKNKIKIFTSFNYNYNRKSYLEENIDAKWS